GGRARAEPESDRLQDAHDPRPAAGRVDPRRAPEPGRAVRREGRRRAAEHRAPGGRRERGGGGRRRPRDDAADHRREGRARALRRSDAVTLRTALLLLPSRPARALAALAARAEELGYDDLWLADERFFRDVYACLATCALATRRIRLATGVTDPYSGHPGRTPAGGGRPGGGPRGRRRDHARRRRRAAGALLPRDRRRGRATRWA